MADFIVCNAEQRSPQWYALRAGRLTGSRASDMLATLKSGGEAAGRRNLRAQLVLERITGRSQERDYMSAAMQDGIDREADAQRAYETLTGHILTAVGFLSHHTIQAGGSPDGVVNNFEGIVEIKAPLAATHLDYLRTGRVPGDYASQIRHLLWLTGAKWCDWLSYHPDFPAPLQVKLVRINRDDQELAAYELAARLFLSEVDKEEAAVRALVPAAEVA